MQNIREMGVRYMVEILSSDVTVSAEKLQQIEDLIDSNTEVGLDEAERICNEEMNRISSTGLCNSIRYVPIATKLIQSSITAFGLAGHEDLSAKDVMEGVAKTIPSEQQECFILGMFTGRQITKFEFQAAQTEAMERAQAMLAGMGMSGVVEKMMGGGGAGASGKSLMEHLADQLSGAEKDDGENLN
jgi:hypothetical protein